MLQGTTLSLQGNVTDNATLDFNQSFNGTFGGNISGTGSLVKDGTGTLILSGTNAYSGGTTVSSGTFQGTTLSLQGDITNNATLDFNQSFNGTYGGNMSGTGNLVKDRTETLIL